MSAPGDQHAVLAHEPMSKHTTWRVGGPADVYYSPRCRTDLLDFLRSLKAGTPVTFVGLGSNLLVRDGGIRGAVVATGQALNEVRNLGGGRVEAGAGVPCTVLARQCGRWQLGPAEWFAGIPGTVGGALRMNAGAFGGETWARVLEVDVVTGSGEVITRTREDYTVGYREVQGPGDRSPPTPGEFFLAARFAFDEEYASPPGRMQEVLAERARRQPLGLPSCGSVFRNPPGDFAARLIEAAGLKGHRRGAAEVSPKHANFIINTGGATAADIEGLIHEVRSVVAERHGVTLQLEVHIVGEPAPAGAAP
jgi:UDP-N-acetylmuramate dehydrogenase